MAVKYFYYVIVKSDNQAIFVTKIDNATNYAHWDKNEKPLPLTKSYAEDLAWCLPLNFFPAFVLMSAHELKKQIFYKEQPNEQK